TPERLKRVLDLSSTQVSRLTALIDDLLDISRIDSGKLSYRFEPYDLSTLAHEMAERYAEPLAASGCSIEVKANESLPVSIDRFRMEQVLANLLTNAARYGKSGPVRIETFRRGD